MVAEVVVGNRDPGAPTDGIHKPVIRLGEVAMVDPNVVAGENGDGRPVRPLPVAHMTGATPNHRGTRGNDIVHMDPMDDNVLNELNLQPRPAGQVHVGAAAVDRLVRCHNELVLELDLHVAAERDPQRPVLQNAVAERAIFRVDDVVVAVVGDGVDAPVLAARGVFPKPDGAVRQGLAIDVPVRV